jgi:hypothetical protein
MRIDWLQSQGLDHYRLGEHPSIRSDPDDKAFVSDILSLGVFRPGWLRPKLDVDHASHVSFNVSMASM